MLRVDVDELDETRFRALVESAREARDERRLEAAAATFRRALALWRGEPLQGLALPWAEAERARLQDLHVAVVEERIDVDLQLGRAAELVSEFESLAAAHPLRERLRAQLMLALYATGRQADAIAAYRQARRDLDEVGLEPGPRLRELEQAILRQDPQLTTAPLGRAPTASRRPQRRCGLPTRPTAPCRASTSRLAACASSAAPGSRTISSAAWTATCGSRASKSPS